MTAPLFSFIVWRDRYPSTPLELDVVRAATKADAERLARERFPGVKLLVQSAASARIAAREPRPRPDPRRATDYSHARRAKRRAAQRHQPPPTPTNPHPDEAA